MTAAAPMTPTTRDEALAQFVAAGARFSAAFTSLSDTQWSWSPDDKTWAARQIAEHLVMLDELTTTLLGDRFTTFPEVSFTEEQRARKDAMLPRVTVDRNTKLEAPAPIRPAGRYATPGEFLSAFSAARAVLATKVGASAADLRSRALPHPALGMLDGVQWLIFSVAHGDRHLAQLAELRAHPGFPAA